MACEIHLSLRDSKGLLPHEAIQAGAAEALGALERITKGIEGHRPFTGWVSVDEFAGRERVLALVEMAKKVRADADAFVTIGIGGSNQAARAAVKALCPEGRAPQMLWAGNTLSAFEVQRLISRLEEKQSIYINCIAKNFQTLEPGAAFRVLRQYLERRYGETEAAKRIFATGTPKSPLEALCKQQGYTFLTFPETIGGRFSVMSDVGLFPMAVAGIDIVALTDGMRFMREGLFADRSAENPAVQYALLRNLLLKKGYGVEMLSFFEPRLDYFAKWWIQAFGESEGKNGTGLYPVAASYSEDLHAIGQFVQEGSPLLFETFLKITHPGGSFLFPQEDKDDGFDYLLGKDFAEINKIAQEATLRAHCDRGIPCMELTVERLDAFCLGEMFYFFLLACYISCELLGVNPFDQPGVEAYKGYMFENLKK